MHLRATLAPVRGTLLQGKNEKLKIGVLSLQGSVIEHLGAVRRAGGEAVEVNAPPLLDAVDGLILPGGESTTLGKLLRFFGLHEPLKEKLAGGFPCFGTCAGLILLAKEIVGEAPHLGVMDITVRRNAYGRQIDSFAVRERIPAFSDAPLDLTFIRAPWIERVYGEAKVLKELNGKIVAARQGNMLVTSFHPELTKEAAVHAYFLRMVAAWKAGQA